MRQELRVTHGGVAVLMEEVGDKSLKIMPSENGKSSHAHTDLHKFPWKILHSEKIETATFCNIWPNVQHLHIALEKRPQQ